MYIDSRGYAYETYRDGPHVRRRYLGSGIDAGLLVRLSQRDRDNADYERWLARKCLEDLQKATKDLQAPVLAFWNVVQGSVEAELEANGYRQHARGPWRKKRGHSMEKELVTQDLPFDPVPKAAELNALVHKASEGDKAAAKEVWKICDDIPGIRDWIMEQYGNLSLQAQASFIRAMAGENLMLKEGTHQAAQQMRQTLAGPTPTPLELLLVDRIVTCWVQVNYYETLYAQNMGSLTLRQGDFHQRRLDAANRRYLQSISALAQVRKLKLPNVQINVGQNQMNVTA